MNYKKKICFVNGSTTGSTGAIVNLLARKANESGYSCLFLSRGQKSPNYTGQYINVLPHRLSYCFSRLPTLLFDGDGFHSRHATYIAIKAMSRFLPRILHIHNPHGSFTNFQMLVNYAKANSLKVIWTLHDTWGVTGRCACPFSCDSWKIGCPSCTHHSFYPRVIFSKSDKFYKLKHDSIQKLIGIGAIFVSPSVWLLNLFKESYPTADVRLIRNGIEHSIFKLDGSKNIEVMKFANGRKIIGGTSLSEGKGGPYFDEISKFLDPSKYCVVVTGCRQSEIVSKNLMHLKSLRSKQEMASFYRSLEILLSPTQNDNFPTTHLESISCGTPVLTFNVGGAAEMIISGINGYAVSLNDKSALIGRLKEMLNRTWDRQKVSLSQPLSSNEMSSQYITLYENVCSDLVIR